MKVLLIVPKFFTYEIYIKKELQNLGYNVRMIYENANEFSLKTKAQINIIGDKKKYFERYYMNAIEKEVYDFVLVIRGSSLSVSVLNYIRERMPNCKMHMYQWDSVRNNPNALTIAPLFDKVSTFDLVDAKKYGWNYRPLFYIESSPRCEARKYDIAYICTLHSQRIKVFNKLKDYKCSKLLYMYSKFSHFVKERYLKHNQDFKGVSIREVMFRSLTLEKSNSIMSNSNIIVDYTHPGQTGFTMRTCEAIGHRCKLITNNKMVYEADFYDPANIYVYDIENFMIPTIFGENPFKELDRTVYERYSISNWIKEIIDYE